MSRKSAPKGLDAATVKYVMSGLLILTGIIHLFVGAFMGANDPKAGVLAFGVIFLAAGAYVRAKGRTPVFVAMAASALGLAIGGATYLMQGGPISLPLMFFIDVLVLLAGAKYLSLEGTKT